MWEVNRELASMKMCLSHSQTRIERGLCDLEGEFRQWQDRPHSRSIRGKLQEDLENFRWLLDQHFTRLGGEGYLESLAHREPSLYGELRHIECWQARLIDHLDTIIDRLRHFDDHQSIDELARNFVSLHDDILREESEERQLVQRSLA